MLNSARFLLVLFNTTKQIEHEKSNHTCPLLPFFRSKCTGNFWSHRGKDEYRQDQCHRLCIQKYQSVL